MPSMKSREAEGAEEAGELERRNYILSTVENKECCNYLIGADFFVAGYGGVHASRWILELLGLAALVSPSADPNPTGRP